MVRLFEYEGKNLLEKSKIPIPKGFFVKTHAQARDVAAKLNVPVVVKAQVLAGRRGRVGGIRFADTPSEAAEMAKEVLKLEIAGKKVQRILVEEKLDILKEYYTGITADDSIKSPRVFFSTEGGVEIEEIAEKHPEKIVSMPVDILEGVRDYQIRNLVRKLEDDGKNIMGLSNIVLALYNRVYRGYDARAAEINPIVLTRDGKFFAADARIDLDEEALFRHRDIEIKPIGRERPPERTEIAWYELESKDYRGTWFYIQFVPEQKLAEEGGYIGFHCVGGGGSMISMDALVREGLKLANYCDTSGNPPASKVYRAAKVVLSQPNIDGYCFITCMANQPLDITARGIVKAVREIEPKYPLLIRNAGNKEEEAHKIIRDLTSDLPCKIELYGREVDEVFCAKRMKELVTEFRKAVDKS